MYSCFNKINTRLFKNIILRFSCTLKIYIRDFLLLCITKDFFFCIRINIFYVLNEVVKIKKDDIIRNSIDMLRNHFLF